MAPLTPEVASERSCGHTSRSNGATANRNTSAADAKSPRSSSSNCIPKAFRKSSRTNCWIAFAADAELRRRVCATFVEPANLARRDLSVCQFCAIGLPLIAHVSGQTDQNSMCRRIEMGINVQNEFTEIRETRGFRNSRTTNKKHFTTRVHQQKTFWNYGQLIAERNDAIFDIRFHPHQLLIVSAHCRARSAVIVANSNNAASSNPRCIKAPATSCLDPRAREGATRKLPRKAQISMVSIHAPVKARHAMTALRPVSFKFRSTRP